MLWPQKNLLILIFTVFLLFPIIPAGAIPAITDSIEAPCDSGGFLNDNCTAPNELPAGEQVEIQTNYTVGSNDNILNYFCLVEDGSPASCSSLGGGTLIDADCTDNGDIFFITGAPDWTFPSGFSCSYDSSTGKILCDGSGEWVGGVYYNINWTLEACSGDRGSSSDIYSECTQILSGIATDCDSILLGLNITNAPPTHNPPIITPYPTYTTDNITCTNQSTSDLDGDSVTNIYNWLKDGTSITVLNMPFDTNVSDTTTGDVKDYSGYNNNGTLNSGSAMPTWTTDGKLGGAFSFDGDDMINISKSSTLNNTYNFTITFWIKPAQVTSSSTVFTNMNSGTISNGEFVVSQSIDDDVGFIVSSTNNKVVVNNVLTVGTWTHVAAVMVSGDNMSIFINGSYDASDTTIDPGPYMNSSNDFFIGARGDATEFFNGTLDELRLYNYSLTPQQINRLYIEGLNNLTNSTIVSQETVTSQNWTCEVTPNDAIDDGITKSNSTIIGLCNPPTDSDWDISIPVICQDKVIYLAQDKNLNIMNGGSLTLINTTLWINMTEDDNSQIYVYSGGAMNITDNNGDGSMINSTNVSNEFVFEVNAGSNFSMTNSRLEECGSDPLNLGLDISTTVTEFSGNTLTNNYYGAVFYSDNNIIANNTINSNNDYGIFLSGSDNNTISNNTISNNNNGIYLDISNNNTISNNTISNNNNGIYLYGSNNTLRNNILGSNSVNIYFYSFVLPTWGNILIDSVLTNPTNYDIQAATALSNYNNNTLLNTTFNKSSVSLEDGSVIYVKWYLNVYVTDIPGNIVENANVTARDNSNNLAFSELTGSDGYIQRQNVTEYFENATGKYFLTSYTINTVSPCCESDSRPLNLTESTILNIILTPFYALQITLNINNTGNTVYIPGTGEIPASQLGSGTNYTNHTHNYLASYNSTSLAALVAQTAIRLFVSNTTTYHTIQIYQPARNSRVFLVFTKGNWQTIDNRMMLIESGQFLAKISPSFAFGLGITYPIKLLLSYSDIDIQGDIILQSGRQGLIVNYSETINDTPVIFIRRI